jgi:hypothetical protein
MIETYDIQFSYHVIMLSPLGFRVALYLWRDAKVVLTVSGGLQEVVARAKITSHFIARYILSSCVKWTLIHFFIAAG